MSLKEIYLSNPTREFLELYSLKLIKDIAKEENIDENLVRAIAEKESRLYPFAFRVEPRLRARKWYIDVMSKYNKDSRNLLHTASYGLLQILYVNTLKYPKIGPPVPPLLLLSTPDLALQYGIWHLKGLLDRYDRVEDAVSAYNWGHSTRRNREQYVNPIMRRLEELAASP